MVWMSKVDVRLQFSRYFFMLRKLFAIIECNGMASLLSKTDYDVESSEGVVYW
jgi:hypothetical protein